METTTSPATETAKRKAAAKAFADKWTAAPGDEKQETQSFWIELLQEVLGVRSDSRTISFEMRVKVGNSTRFIDAYLPDTRVLIEQKSSSIDMDAPQMQSGGDMLTPYEQAKRYSDNLPVDKHARWIVTCNFREIRIHDMNAAKPAVPVSSIALAELPEQWHRLQFLVDARNSRVEKEKEMSMQAGVLISRIYNALLENAESGKDAATLQSMNKFCVRLVFCLYAEDAGLFRKNQFWEYLADAEDNPRYMRSRILQLFRALNMDPEKRDRYDKELLAFPYVDGGLFDDGGQEIPDIPMLDENLCELIKDAAHFDWREISPTIFGGLFESTLNPATRRIGGMHYTSVENIHKVIDPLFLDALKEELRSIAEAKRGSEKARAKKLEEYRDKLASLIFLDPACGSGNFLTETFISLRRLENDALRYLSNGQGSFGGELSRVKVTMQQFYGIEINDFAVSVAKAALWIADAQMWQETQEFSTQELPDFLPLRGYDNIRENDALFLDWTENTPARHVDYIISNPPFVGSYLQHQQQKEGLLHVCKGIHGAGDLDYVAAWFVKAAEIMQQDPATRTTFVATNSITQGQSVAFLWRHILQERGMKINFAYRTFKWANETKDTAAVHCVIVGFSGQKTPCRLFDEQGGEHSVSRLNGYLIEADDVFIDNRQTPLCNVPVIIKGNQPTDDGNLLFTEEEYRQFISATPEAAPLFRKILGAKEFLHNISRYCLWITPDKLSLAHRLAPVKERIAAVREFRLKSPKAATRKCAESPWRFQEIRQPESDYILIPRHSSENRRYVPFGFLGHETIVSDAVTIIPNATLYHFGVLTSAMHMVWMRTVAGRLKSDYRYSNKVVYNNFPWASPGDKQREKIEACAQAVLDARALYSGSSLAELYDPLMMPPELRKAHSKLDAAVDAAYGRKFADDSDRVTHLFALYQKLTKKGK